MSKFDMIVELMVKNGVTTKFSENLFKNLVNDEPIIELDFSEHDKVFEDKIKSLQDECAKLHKQLMETEKDMQDEIVILNKQIADLQWELAGKEVDEEKTEPVKESLPSIEWFDNRHQSDCIEINRLNTTIDVLIHKVEYLRQFAGLE